MMEGYIVKREALLLIFVFFSCLIISEAVTAADFGVAVVNNSANQSHPDVYGSKVVWTDERNGNPDIYMKDLATNHEVPVTTNTAIQRNPKISGNIVVWQDFRKGNWDILMKNLKTNKVTTVCTHPSTQINPAIYGYRVVWQDLRNGNWDIYTKNLMTGITSRVTNNNADQVNPAISGNRVVWMDQRYGHWDILVKNFANGASGNVKVNSHNKYNPSISGNVVVWQENRFNIHYNIWMKNIVSGTEKQVSREMYEHMKSYGNQINPKISGNTVVWSTLESDGVGDWYDIWMANITGTAIVHVCSNVNYRQYPAINGNRIVWQNTGYVLHDWNTNSDIYTKTFWPLYFETTPKDMEMLYPKTQDIIIRFSEPIKTGTNFQSITVTDSDTNTLTAIKKTISGSVLTLHNIVGKIAGHTYNVFIPETSVKDSNNRTLLNDIMFWFRTTPEL